MASRGDYRPAMVNWDVPDDMSRKEAFEQAERMIRAAQTFMIGTQHNGCALDEVDAQIIEDLLLGISAHVTHARKPRKPRKPRPRARTAGKVVALRSAEKAGA